VAQDVRRLGNARRVRRHFLLRWGRGTTRNKIALHPPAFILDDTRGASAL